MFLRWEVRSKTRELHGDKSTVCRKNRWHILHLMLCIFGIKLLCRRMCSVPTGGTVRCYLCCVTEFPLFSYHAQEVTNPHGFTRHQKYQLQWSNILLLFITIQCTDYFTARFWTKYSAFCIFTLPPIHVDTVCTVLHNVHAILYGSTQFSHTFIHTVIISILPLLYWLAIPYLPFFYSLHISIAVRLKGFFFLFTPVPAQMLGKHKRRAAWHKPVSFVGLY